MRVDLSQLDAETSNLHLVVDATATLDVPRAHVPSEVSRAVQSITRSQVLLPPGFGGFRKSTIRVDPLLGIDEPVEDEFLLRQFWRAQVTFGQASCANVDLPRLTDGA